MPTITECKALAKKLGLTLRDYRNNFNFSPWPYCLYEKGEIICRYGTLTECKEHLKNIEKQMKESIKRESERSN